MDGVPMALPATVGALAGREVVLGLRPEHLQVGGEGLTMAVETVEILGAEHLIHGVIAGHDVIIRTGTSDHPEPGSTLTLGFPASAMHWFDAATCQRIDA
jgi:sn-glycerol 3-phosphate transport system ATP-binding protein